MSTFEEWEVPLGKSDEFQIGDKVTLSERGVKEFSIDNWADYSIPYAMFRGFVGTVTKVEDLDGETEKRYYVRVDQGGECFFYGSQLQLIEYANVSKRIGALKGYPTEDKVNKPNHYQLKGDFEVKHLMELLLDRIEESDKVQFSHFQSSCYKEMMQYLLRFMLKNGYEDIYKARYYLNEVIRVHEERMQS